MGRERCHPGRQRALDDTFHEGANYSLRLTEGVRASVPPGCAPLSRRNIRFIAMQVCRYMA